MEAGGKAHSAPFCLLSARCHGTEGVQSRRRGSQGLAGPWALSKGKLLEGKKKYRGSMMPAAKRAKPLYLLEELWHPGTSVFERPESLERLLQQAGVQRRAQYADSSAGTRMLLRSPKQWCRGSVVPRVNPYCLQESIWNKRPCHGCFVTRSFVLVLLCRVAYAMPAVMMAIL